MFVLCAAETDMKKHQILVKFCICLFGFEHLNIQLLSVLGPIGHIMSEEKYSYSQKQRDFYPIVALLIDIYSAG